MAQLRKGQQITVNVFGSLYRGVVAEVHKYRFGRSKPVHTYVVDPATKKDRIVTACTWSDSSLAKGW